MTSSSQQLLLGKHNHPQNENAPIECASLIHIHHKVNIKTYQELTQLNSGEKKNTTKKPMKNGQSF